MAQRILVFEKDTNFLRELETGFERYGAHIEVVHDPEAGIASAKDNSPALVLLSVDAMSAPGEAFLVCKRFKSDDDLAKVPFVIMGGRHHAESFESHKKLKKRRADEYIELPVAFDSLVDMLKPFVTLEAQTNGVAHDDADLNVDADIDAFADSAFDDLVLEEPKPEPKAPSVPLPPPPVAARADAPPVPPPPRPSSASLPIPPVAKPPSGFTQVSPPSSSTPISSLPPGPAGVAAAAANEALNEEVARLRRQLDDLGERSKGAEDRARSTEEKLRAAEDRAKAAEDKAKAAEDRAEQADRRAKEARASIAPSTGVSSRDYLEMREQLNRKDKELLALRDEVTTRDRQLLDASDRTLGLERTQAELEEKLGQTARELEDAQTKIRAYEVDKESANKRLEDLRARITRADDKTKKLEDELDAIKKVHAAELNELKTAHQNRLTDIENTVSTEVARMRADHALELENAETKAAEELRQAEARRARELGEQKSAHESAVSALNASHENELASLKAAHASLVEDERNRAAQALSEQRAAGEAALAQARAEAQADKERVLDEAARAHRAELEQKLSDAELARNAALEGQKRELEAKYAAQQKELEERHGRELAVLGRKLNESDSKASALREQLEGLEQAKAELEATTSARISSLEGELSARTGERDTANNELSAARATIQTLERTGENQTQRIARLEADLSETHDRLRRAETKIQADEELLDRVRKALGIGIGLLEQQKQNGLESL